MTTDERLQQIELAYNLTEGDFLFSQSTITVSFLRDGDAEKCRDAVPWLIGELRDARAENERLAAAIAAMDDDADQALDDKAEAVEAESQAGDRIAAERDGLRAKLAAAEADVKRIINALDDTWADNSEFEGWGDVEGMVRTVQTLCRRYAEETDRAEAAERQLAAVRKALSKRLEPVWSYSMIIDELVAALSSEGGESNA